MAQPRSRLESRQRTERALQLLGSRGALDADGLACALDPYCATSTSLLKRRSRSMYNLLLRLERDGLVRGEIVQITSTKRVVRFSRAQPAPGAS